MHISNLCFNLFGFFLPPAVIATVCLYFYAALLDCTFPPARSGPASCSVSGSEHNAVSTEIAPFRLLALGDPQLEGDSSLPDPDVSAFPSFERLASRLKRDGLGEIPSNLRQAGEALLLEDLPAILQGYRKRLDLWGNDLYLAHIYRTVSWWSQPTHTVVLGDLLGSQHIGDEEFMRRSDRFWSTVFAGAEKVPRTVTDISGGVEVLGEDQSWRKRVIAVAGNHDIGYAGQIDEQMIERFEETFGSVNWEIRFRLGNASTHTRVTPGSDTLTAVDSVPELRVVVLNSMNLDGPAKDERLQNQSREFVTQQLYQPRPKSTGTVLLTHIPLHKKEGICVDGPYFDYLPAHRGGGIKEQNHLSEAGSAHILEGLVSPDRPGNAIILNGHDHEGCDTYHYRRAGSGPTDNDDGTTSSTVWQAEEYSNAYSEVANDTFIGVQELTVRSMMGEFGGHAFLLSAWYDQDTQEWQFAYKDCMLGVQHIWWAIHIFDIVVIGLGLTSLVAFLWEDMRARTNLIVQQEASNMSKIKAE